MRQNLTDLITFLDRIDNNPQHCMNFLNDPLKIATRIELMNFEHPDKVTKMELIFGLIRGTVVHYDNPISREDLEDKVKKIYLFIDSKYDTYQWRLHDCHFHTDFGHYVNCTYTTASEISEVFNKILGINFHA